MLPTAQNKHAPADVQSENRSIFALPHDDSDGDDTAQGTTRDPLQLQRALRMAYDDDGVHVDVRGRKRDALIGIASAVLLSVIGWAAILWLVFGWGSWR